jgi:hypothetical protein
MKVLVLSGHKLIGLHMVYQLKLRKLEDCIFDFNAEQFHINNKAIT